jgi:hypothetical protein
MQTLLVFHRSTFKALVGGAVGLIALAPSAPAAGQSLWSSTVTATNTVVSSPTSGGGYPENPPVAGGCVGPTAGQFNFNANHSESDLAVEPGTEQIVGSSKFFFDKFSTGYNFYLGSYDIKGSAHSNQIIQGYDCSTTETTPGVLNQNMPPSWTNTTDPNVAFDTKGRVYQTMLPFNAFWTNLHPDGEITLSYSDDLGAHWITGNGGQPLEQNPNASSFQFGFVEDKQWIAVNHYPGSKFQDHVYSTWDVINGTTVKLRMAVSRDRGLTFSPAQTIVSGSIDQMRNQFSQTGVAPDGTLYVAYANFANKSPVADMFVTRSTDDGNTFSTPVLAATGTTIGVGSIRDTNTTFRDGINFGFAVSPDFPGHLYLAYGDFNGTQYNVFFVQSTEGGQTWSKPIPVNDDIFSGNVADHFQPNVAAGPGGAVAVGFYDRREACPSGDPSIIPQDVGRTNFCIDVSVQPYTDAGTTAGASAVGGNIRASNFTWDPQQPGLLVKKDGTTADLQTLGGLGQMACASHNDPCTLSFIGDYFGIAISGGNIYTLSVSTHYPSNVVADDGTTLYYQQQVLSTISRSSAGI